MVSCAKAAKCFDKAIKLDPSNVLFYSEKGSACLGCAGVTPLKCCGQALKLDPSNVRCLIGKGAAYSMLKEHAETLKCCKQAAAWMEANMEKFLLEKTLEKLNRLDEALRHDSIMEEQVEKPFSYLFRARLLHKLGRHDAALKCYDKAVKVLEGFMDSVDGSEAYLDRHGTNPEFPIWDCPICSDALAERGCGTNSDTPLWNERSLRSEMGHMTGHGTLPQLAPF